MMCGQIWRSLRRRYSERTTDNKGKTSTFRAVYEQLITRKPLYDIFIQLKEKDNLKRNRSLGFIGLNALGLGALIGAGISTLVGYAAAEFAGPAEIFALVIAAVPAFLSAMSYAELASMVPASGSSYTYTYTVLGEFCAFIVGWDLLLEYMCAIAGVGVAWASYIGALIEIVFQIGNESRLLEAPLKWNSTTDSFSLSGSWFSLPAVIIILVLTALIIWDIGASSVLNTVMVAAKMAILLLFILVGTAYIKEENFYPLLPPQKGKNQFGVVGLLRASTISFFAYIGFDAVTTAAQEANENAVKLLPISVLTSVGIATIVYIGVATVMIGAVGYTNINVTNPFKSVCAVLDMKWLEILVTIGIFLGLTSVILVNLYCQSRIVYAMATDGLLPPIFTKTKRFRRRATRENAIIADDPRSFSINAITTGSMKADLPSQKIKRLLAVTTREEEKPPVSPFIACAIPGVISATVAGFLPIEFLAEMTSIGTLFAFCFVHASVIRMHWTHKPNGSSSEIDNIIGSSNSFESQVSLAVNKRIITFPSRQLIWPIVGILSCMSLMYFITTWTIIRFVVWNCVLGQLMYWFYSRKHSIYGNQRNTQEFLSSMDPTNPSINNVSEPQQSEIVSLPLNVMEMQLTSTIRTTEQRKQYNATSLATNTKRTRVILLWYNPNMDSSLECEETKLMLSNIIENLRIYRLEGEFLNYLNTAKNEEPSTDTGSHLRRRILLLVLAGEVAEQFLTHTENFHSVEAVYILSEEKSSYEPLKNRFRKLKGIYTKRVYLERALSRDLKHYAVYHFYHDNTTQTSTWDLTTRKVEFLWFQQVQKMLLDPVSSSSPEAKRDFISICHDYCDKHYKNDRRYLKYLEDRYKAKDAIKEYTKANFLHELVNRALRTEDIEEVYRFRWYLAQLCTQLEQETKYYRRRQQRVGVSVIKLYRGQLCSPDELKRIRGGSDFIATNGFLSTTYDRNVAVAFAESAKGASGGDMVLLLLEITVDLNQISSTVLTEISHLGNFKQEEEVLFGLGAHFKTEGECVRDEEGRWILKMQAIDLGKETASNYASKRLTEMSKFAPSSSQHSTFLKMILSQMLIEMGQYKKAIKFLALILPTTDEERAIHCFGLADAKLSCFGDQDRVTTTDEAVALLAEALDLFISSKNLLGTADTLRRLADALVLKEEYPMAKNYYQQAHRIYKEIHRPETDIANCINGLADVYLGEKSYDFAEILYKDALEKRRSCLSDEDPAIGRSYYSLGRYYYFKRNNEKNAEFMIDKALKQKMKIYPPDHPSVQRNYLFQKILLPLKKRQLFERAPITSSLDDKF